MHENYRECLDFLENAGHEEVNGFDFYRDIFPDNENMNELHMDYSHPNALYLHRDERDKGTQRRLRRRVMYNDTWENDYTEYVEQNPMTLCSGLVYRKNTNTIKNAQRMNALIFDVDGVGHNEMLNLFHRFKPEINFMPLPTYIVLSGSGVHVYYVLETPFDLYPNIKPQAKKLKYWLTRVLWNWKITSQEKQVQFQGINQGFRMVGSINERHGTEIKAFRIGDRISIEKLNSYANKDSRMDLNREHSEPSEVAKHYPKKWKNGVKNGDKLYEWWLKKSEHEDFKAVILGGHRYFYLMCLSIYASKCNVPFERLKDDMAIALERLKTIGHSNELTEYDMQNALKAYDKNFYNFTIDDIEQLTAIRIERNRRNGRTQEQHLQRARLVQLADYPNGEWRNKDGRPSAQVAVKNYRAKNPEAKKADCHRETKLSWNTIRKWWNSE